MAFLLTIQMTSCYQIPQTPACDVKSTFGRFFIGIKNTPNKWAQKARHVASSCYQTVFKVEFIFLTLCEVCVAIALAE